MNCLTEALGLSLPGNGTVVATHADRRRLFVEAGHLVVDLARRWYEEDDEGALPRGIATLQGVRERHVARHRHGRFDQHRPAPARRRARGRDRLHHGRYRPAVAPRSVSVQGRSVRGGCACRGRPSRRRGDGYSGRARPRRPPQSRRPHGARRVARACAVAQRHHARDRKCDARVLPGRARRRADPGRVQPVGALSLARRGSRQGRHPRFRARLLQGRRPCGAVRQHRARRLDREDRGGRRRQSQVQRPGAHLRKPGRRGPGNPGRQGRGRRRRRHPLRGAARRPGHAGDALSDQLSEIARARQGLRLVTDGRFSGGTSGLLDRPRLAGSGRRRRDRPHRRRRHDRDRHSRALDRTSSSTRRSSPSAARRWKRRARTPGSRPSRASGRCRRLCAPTPPSRPARRAARFGKCRKASSCSRR